MPKRRDWTAAVEKVRQADGLCRVCGRPGAEAAHVIGRRVDRKVGSTFKVNPAGIVPLCGPSTDTGSCHCAYDEHRLDLLPYLSLAEQCQAVQDAGGIAAAYFRTTGSRTLPGLDEATEERDGDRQRRFGIEGDSP